MATSSLHPHSSNPFRDPNRTPSITPQATGSSAVLLNPFLSQVERLSPQATGASQYFTPQPTGAVSPAATGALSAPQTESATAYVPPGRPPPSRNTPSLVSAPTSPIQSTFAPPPGPPPQRSTYAPPPGSPPRPRSAPRASSPPLTVSITEPPPPYTPAADTRHGEIPLETGPRRAYAPEWHPDGQVWRNEHILPSTPSPPREESQWDQLAPAWRRDERRPSSASGSSSRPSIVVSQTGDSSWSGYPGQSSRPPPRHPSMSASLSPTSASGPSLGRSNTTVGTSCVPPGPPTTVPTPGRALLNRGKVLAYPAGYECNKCHLTGYQAYDPSNPCRECWSLFAQPYEGPLTFAPWDSPESVMSDEQNLQRPLAASVSRPQPNVPRPSTRPLSHPQPSSSSTYAILGQPLGSLPSLGWSSSSSLRPSVSFSGRAPPGAVVVRPGDPRIGGRVCWKCSGDGWQYKTMGLETKTCSACNGLGRLF